MTDLVILTNENPQRPPDWAWRFVRYLDQTGRQPNRIRHGRLIARARQFVADLQSTPDPNDRMGLVGPHYAIYHAWMIYTGSIRRVRWELEARLLATEEPASIAEKMGVSKDVILAYAGLYFDVENTSTSYIMHVVLRTGEQRFSAERGQELLWKTVAYRYGAAALDGLLYLTQENGTSITTAKILDKEIQSVLAHQTAVAVNLLDVSPQSAGNQLTAAGHMQPGHSAEAVKYKQENDDIRAGIQSFLENVPWTRDAAKAQKLGLIHPLEKGGVGLRSEELMRLAAGEQLTQEFIELIKSAKYPPPTKSSAVTTQSMLDRLAK
jgi:hypothetical protein